MKTVELTDHLSLTKSIIFLCFILSVDSLSASPTWVTNSDIKAGNFKFNIKAH